jgi:RHS repeat-associated protein
MRRDQHRFVPDGSRTIDASPSRSRMILLACILMLAAGGLHAQFYTDQAWDLKQKSSAYDEQGFDKGKAITVDGKLNIIESNGALGYSYPIADYAISGYPVRIELNYANSVSFSAFCDYNKGPFKHTGGSSAQAWRQFGQNRPAWIIGVNGWAVQLLDQVTAFHSAPHKVNTDFHTGTSRRSFDDRDFLWLAEGYDFSNRMKSMYNASYEDGFARQDFVDVIKLLRADGSVMELHNSKNALMGADVYFSDSLYVGFYHTNEVGAHTFATVSIDDSRLPDFIPADSSHYFRPRILRLYDGSGLEYVFREYILPYGTADWRDSTQQFGGAIAGPSIFYLEEINSNAGQLMTFARTRHTVTFEYDGYGDPIDRDSTRGRALVTDFDATSITYGNNMMAIQSMGRTTLVKFDEVLGSHDAAPATGAVLDGGSVPFTALGYNTAWARSLATDDIDGDQYAGYAGYVTQIIDPENRVTTFDYETVRRSYKGFGFPVGGSDEAYSVNLENVRLKKITEPDTRYEITYNATPALSTGRLTPYGPEEWIPIHAKTATDPTWEPWLLNNVVSKVEKYDCSQLIKTDEYGIISWGGQNPGSTTQTEIKHAITDNIAGTTRWMKYIYGFHWLPDILPNLPRGRFTEMLRMADSIPGYSQVTETAYDSLAPFTMVPISVTTSVNGIPKTLTTYSYQLDTARRFNDDPNLIAHYGMEIGTKTEISGCACDSSLRSLVIPGMETTTKFLYLSDSSAGQRWVKAWGFDKLKSIHNYDSAYSIVVGGDTLGPSHNPHAPTWEEAMYWPGIGVYEWLDTMQLVAPPVYGLQQWTRTTDGHSGITEYTTYTSAKRLDTVPQGRIASTWKTGFVGLGTTRTTRPDSFAYRQVLGRWLISSAENANGAATGKYYLTHHASPALDDDNANAYWLSGNVLDDRDSIRTIELADGDYFALSYEQPSAERALVRKPAIGGTTVDTLDTYTERTFYGLAGGTVDANGWYSRAEYDKNGRLTSAWLPADFGSGHLTDTSAVIGLLASSMYGYTIDTLVSDTVNCDPAHPNGAAVREVEQISGDMWASNPVIIRPKCFECVKTKGDNASTQATCTQPRPYQYRSKALGIFHVPIVPVDASEVVSLDSAYLRLLITSITGSCVHLEVKIPQFNFTRTYVFNCTGLGSGPSDAEEDFSVTSPGGGGNEAFSFIAGGGCGQTMTHPAPSGFILKVDLSSIKDSLTAHATLGQQMTVQLGVPTSGAEVRFSGDFYDDYRPQLVMKGSFKSFQRHDDYTLAYRHIDDSLATEMTAKVDDSRHTASRYAPSGTFVVRAMKKRYQFGADYRVDKSYTTIGDPAAPTRVDSTLNLFKGLGQAMHAIDENGDTLSTTYDAAGRTVDVRNADGTHTTIAYYYGTDTTFGIPPMMSIARYTTGDFDTTVTYACHFIQARVMTNEDGTKNVQYFDALDRLRREVADSGGGGHLNLTTIYDYDGLGRLTTVVNPKGDVTWYTYDALGKTRYKNQPDLGTVSYAYDDLGNVRFTQSQEQADSNRLTFSEYDDLNRLTLVGEASVDVTGGGGLIGLRPASVGKERTRLLSSGASVDTNLHRLTDTLDPRFLHTGTGASSQPVTYNTTLYQNPVVSVPGFASLGAFTYSLCGLPADTMLGETAAPIAPFIKHPVQQYEPITSPRASLTDFENIASYPHFARMAIAYDELPSVKGTAWVNFPSTDQWDSLAPMKKVRNQRGHTAAIAYREHGGEPFHYVVQSYDERGRVEALLRWTENLGFDAVYYNYNALNQVTTVRVLDPLRQFQTWYGYDWNGRVDSVWSQLGSPGSGFSLASPRYKAPLGQPTAADITYSYTKTGQVAAMQYPPVSVLVSYAYNHRKWLDSMVATQSASPLFKEVLGYDPTGQIVAQRFTHGTGTEQTELYRYDSVQRLVCWVHGADSVSWSYDQVGNRTGQIQRLPLAGQRIDSYSYGGLSAGGANRLADVITQDSAGAVTGLREFGYNANGSTTSRIIRPSVGGTITSENHLAYSYRELTRQYIDGAPASSSRWDWRYRYSPGGEREQKRLYYGPDGFENGNVYPWVYYALGGHKEQLAVYHGQQTRGLLCSDTGTVVYFYPDQYLTYGGGDVPDLIIDPRTSAREYQLTDQLGSVRATVTSSTIQTMDYEPFGGKLSTTALHREFIGKGHDPEMTLNCFGMRFYDPLTGRFMSTDPLWEKFPSETPFSYGVNNPLLKRDPSGENPGILAVVAAAAAIGAIAEMGSQVYTKVHDEDKSFKTAFAEMDWADVGTAAAGGALIGLIGATTGGVGAGSANYVMMGLRATTTGLISAGTDAIKTQVRSPNAPKKKESYELTDAAKSFTFGFAASVGGDLAFNALQKSPVAKSLYNVSRRLENTAAAGRPRLAQVARAAKAAAAAATYGSGTKAQIVNAGATVVAQQFFDTMFGK